MGWIDLDVVAFHVPSMLALYAFSSSLDGLFVCNIDMHEFYTARLLSRFELCNCGLASFC